MTVPFALSIHSFVSSVGSYVGFASIVAVALLIILYFAHARETATLRDRLDEAQQRISGLEARIGQLMQTQQRGRPAGAPAPSPVAARPAGAPQGSVRRVPNPATAAGTASPAAPPAVAAAAAAPRQPTAVPAAPAGVGGPALASATRVIPNATEAGAPDDTMFVPAAAAANGSAGSEHTAVLAAAPRPALAAAARPASASPRGDGTPPRMQIGAEEASAPATAAGGSPKVRRIAGHPEPAAAVALPSFDDESVGGRFSGAMLPLLIAGLAAIVIIAGLIVIGNSGGSTAGNVSHNGTNAGATGQSLHNTGKHAPAPFRASKVTVAVLNGTAQQGLAGDVGKKLAGEGFKQGNVTNAASQTQGSTFVYFVTGKAAKANRVAAKHVAKALALPVTRVRAAGAGVIQSCTISATGASLGSCGADVIVSVGQDRVNLASATG